MGYDDTDNQHNVPMCEECDIPMHRFGSHDRSSRYVEGWSCDGCGWTEDDELPDNSLEEDDEDDDDSKFFDELPDESPESKMKCEITPNGYALYWKENEVGGRTYFSDEVGCGVFVWDTSLVCHTTLLRAIVKENELNLLERIKKEK